MVVPSEIDDDEEMRRLLAAGDLDMAFLVGDADGRFDVIHVLTDPFCLIAPRSMDFGPTVNADLLRGMAMVGELPSSCQTHVEQGLIALGVDPEFVFRSGDNGAMSSGSARQTRMSIVCGKTSGETRRRFAGAPLGRLFFSW